MLRWIESTGEDFRFVLKFPQTISHEQMLVDVESDTKAFLAVLHILKKAIQKQKQLNTSSMSVIVTRSNSMVTLVASRLVRVLSTLIGNTSLRSQVI